MNVACAQIYVKAAILSKAGSVATQ